MSFKFLPNYFSMMGRRGLVGLFVNKSHGAKGRGIKSRSFFCLIVYEYSFICSMNTFHGPTPKRHARQDKEEEPAGVSGKKGCEKGLLSIRFKEGMTWRENTFATLCNLNVI